MRDTAPTTTTATIASTSAQTTISTTTSSTTTTTTTTTLPIGPLLVVGDWGTGTAPQGSVAGSMQRYSSENEASAILTTGDNFYTDDAPFLMIPFDWAVADAIPFWIAWGNHDIETSRREEAVNAAFDSPPRWGTHRWGDVDIVILDSNQIESSDQLAFLRNALAESHRPTIVVFHHPVYSCSKHGPEPGIRDTWETEFDSEVVLVLNGHEHNYQRFEEAGRTYVVTGGGGRRLYQVGECLAGQPEPSASYEGHHFVSLQIVAGDIAGEVIAPDGTVIDTFVVNLD